MTSSDSASYCTFARGARGSRNHQVRRLSGSGRALAVHFVTRFRHFLEALVRMTPAAFPEKQAVRQCLKVAYNILQHLTTACKILQDAAFSRVMSMSCQSQVAASVQGLESMLKALLQERVLTKVGRLLSDLVGQ